MQYWHHCIFEKRIVPAIILTDLVILIVPFKHSTFNLTREPLPAVVNQFALRNKIYIA